MSLKERLQQAEKAKTLIERLGKAQNVFLE